MGGLLGGGGGGGGGAKGYVGPPSQIIGPPPLPTPMGSTLKGKICYIRSKFLPHLEG